MVLFKTLSGTIPANSNEITFTDSIINSNTIVEAYYNNNDVYTVETWQDGTTIGIVVNDHTVPVGIKVTLNNVNSFEPYDDTDLVNQINGLSDDVSALDGRLDTAEYDIDNLETRMGSAEDDIDALETAMAGKQNVLTAGDNITIENNIISASGGSDDYSTTEKVIGTWYDGKPLYRRVFTGLNIQQNTTAWVNVTDVLGLDIKYVINCHAYYIISDVKILSCGMSEYSYDNTIGLQINSTAGLTRPINILVLEYTKSTD